jgi:hypothetical protein
MASPRWNSTSSGVWSTSTLWDTLATPVSTDNAYLNANAISITDGLNQAAVTLASLHQSMTYTGYLGLAAQTPRTCSLTAVTTTATLTLTAHGFTVGQAIDVSGATQSGYNGTWTVATTPTADTLTYVMTSSPASPATGSPIVKLTEYLCIGATLAFFGEPSNSATAGSGSTRLKVNFGTVANTTVVYNTASSTNETGLEPLRLLGTNAANAAIIAGGRVGFGTSYASETSQWLSISVTGASAVANIGAGTTLANLRQKLGTANLYSACTNVYQTGGTLTTYGSGAITLAELSGTADLRSTGTIATLTINSGGNVTMLNDNRLKTVTTVKMYKGATFSFDPAVVTITNPISVIGGTLADVTINTTAGITVAIVKA